MQDCCSSLKCSVSYRVQQSLYALLRLKLSDTCLKVARNRTTVVVFSVYF